MTELTGVVGRVSSGIVVIFSRRMLRGVLYYELSESGLFFLRMIKYLSPSILLSVQPFFPSVGF